MQLIKINAFGFDSVVQKLVYNVDYVRVFYVRTTYYPIFLYTFQNARIEEVIAHPGYKRQTLFDDIALIRLAEPANFNSGTYL